MVLPVTVTQGVTTGHLSHHGELAVAAGGLDATLVEGQTGHLSDHSTLRAWAAGRGITVVAVTDPASHELAHEKLHELANGYSSTTGFLNDFLNNARGPA